MEWSSYTFMLRARDTWYDARDSQELGSPDGILRRGRGQMRPATVIPRRPQRRLAQKETEVNKQGTYNSSTQTPASASASGVPHQHRRDIGLCRCPVSGRGGGSALTKSDPRSQCHAKPKSQAKELRNSLLLDRQGEQPIASMPREPSIASVGRVHRERLAFPVLEARRSAKENS